jgi:hypothetical protein
VVKSDRNWDTYMRFASTPGAAMYREPMVYVQFISCDDDAVAALVKRRWP